MGNRIQQGEFARRVQAMTSLTPPSPNDTCSFKHLTATSSVMSRNT
jgi:hypothetical protein